MKAAQDTRGQAMQAGPKNDQAAQFKAWLQGRDTEVAFWNSWVQSRGLSWPEDFANRMRADLPISPELGACIDFLDTPALRLLDVGAGPMTSLGKTWHNKRLEICAVDPLAPYYDAMLERAGVTPPVRTTQAFAEHLSAYFPSHYFDVTHARNALDHSYNPLRALMEMLEVTRRGGIVFTDHSRNEAVREGWSGFHQWNFDSRNGDFVIWNREAIHSVNEIFSGVAEVQTVCIPGTERVIGVLRKTIAQSVISANEQSLRVQELLACMAMM